MLPYDRAVLIFNPNSTGAAPELAERLRGELARDLPDLPVRLVPTERAGHALDLARDAAAEGRPLVVSVSGDGGYNEVVNGVMGSGNPDVVCAVLAAGNANDHRRTTERRPLLTGIAEGRVTRLDLLVISVAGTGGWRRYAHSYIGLGLTPIVAVDLEKGSKGSIREMVTVVRAFAGFRPFEIISGGGEPKRFDSIVFANIAQMAKVAELSTDGTPDDGWFEVVTLEHTAKWRVVATAMRAVVWGLGRQPRAREYDFTPVTPMPIQVDGEVMDLQAGVAVSVRIAARALRTVV